MVIPVNSAIINLAPIYTPTSKASVYRGFCYHRSNAILLNKNKLLALLATLEDVASDAPFFTDYATTWFSTKKHSIKPTTFSKYALGTKRLSDIMRMDIQGLIDHMKYERSIVLEEVTAMLYY